MRMKVERRKPMKSSRKPKKNTEAIVKRGRFQTIPFTDLSGLISPFARETRPKKMSVRDTIIGRKPGPGLCKLPSFRFNPAQAKNTPAPIQNRLPRTSGSKRLIVVCTY